jgi:hypothetical protein
MRGPIHGRDEHGSNGPTSLTALLVVPLADLIGVAIYGYARDSASIFAESFMLAAAAGTTGVLVGFVFSIPRTLTSEARPPQGSADDQRIAYQPNTNLEQISDWLTKILVGIGLVQIREIGGLLSAITSTIAPGLGNDDQATAFATVVIIYSLVSGFLAGYLITRLTLQPRFASADRSMVRSVAVEVVQQAVDRQSNVDARALALVGRVLNGEDVEQVALNEVVKSAGTSVKVQTFLRAQDHRRRTWRTNPKDMERAIPVFRALVASDHRKAFHRHFAELGFCLKDKEDPDYQAALEQLSEAIRIRDQHGEADFAIYELNRAICLIMLDGDSDLIRADLAVVRNDRWTGQLMKGVREINTWLGANEPQPNN